MLSVNAGTGVRHAVYGRAEYVVDEPPANEDDEAALLVTAHYVIETLAGALEATAVSDGVKHALGGGSNATSRILSTNVFRKHIGACWGSSCRAGGWDGEPRRTHVTETDTSSICGKQHPSRFRVACPTPYLGPPRLLPLLPAPQLTWSFQLCPATSHTACPARAFPTPQPPQCTPRSSPQTPSAQRSTRIHVT